MSCTLFLLKKPHFYSIWESGSFLVLQDILFSEFEFFVLQGIVLFKVLCSWLLFYCLHASGALQHQERAKKSTFCRKNIFFVYDFFLIFKIMWTRISIHLKHSSGFLQISLWIKIKNTKVWLIQNIYLTVTDRLKIILVIW